VTGDLHGIQYSERTLKKGIRLLREIAGKEVQIGKREMKEKPENDVAVIHSLSDKFFCIANKLIYRATTRPSVR
jgi:hypothetical protein